MPTYRVQVVTPLGELVTEHEVVAPNPGQAAELVVGVPVTRGTTRQKKVLRAKVFWNNQGLTMARFYSDQPARDLT